MEVTDKLGRAGELQYLRSRPDIDVPRLRALILARSRYDRANVRDWLRSLPVRANPSGDVDAAARVLAKASHASEWVRGAVVRYAARVTPDDPHFIVRENVADELADLDRERACSSDWPRTLH